MGRGEKREDGGKNLGPSLIGEGYTRIRGEWYSPSTSGVNRLIFISLEIRERTRATYTTLQAALFLFNKPVVCVVIVAVCQGGQDLKK